MFDSDRFEYIQAIIKLEVENLISKEEREKIDREIEMTPQAERIITQVVDEVHKKSVHEARLDGIEEGLEQGKKDALEDVARNLRDVLDVEEISKCTGLSVEIVKEL